MPRKCAVCCAEEHLLVIDSRIRAGESLTQIAADFSFSEDSLQRHARNHVRGESAHSEQTLEQRLEMLFVRADDLYKSCVAQGNHRGAIDAMSKLVGITADLAKLKPIKGAFEGLTYEDQLEYIKTHDSGVLFRGILDYLVELQDEANARWNPKKDGQGTRSVN